MIPSLRVLAAVSLSTAACLAQYQASNASARRLGMVVNEQYSLPAGSSVTITLDGFPGALFVLAVDTGVPPGTVVPDRAFGIPGLVTPLCFDPLSPGLITVAGVLSPTGTFSTPVALGPMGAGALHWQAFASDALSPSGWAASNGVRRLFTPILSPFPPGVLVNWTGDPFGQILDAESGDLDADGDADAVLLTCGSTIWVVERIGDGFTASTLLAGVDGLTDIELADLDNDNWLDIIASENVMGLGAHVYWNNTRAPGGALPFELGPWLAVTEATTLIPDPRIGTAPTAVDVETADFDGDGLLDFALACGGAPAPVENRLFRNLGSRTFADVTRASLDAGPREGDSRDVEFADVDGDDDYDLVFAVVATVTTPGDELIYLNTGGTYAAAAPIPLVSIPAGDSSFDVLVSDFNGDGRGDVYVSNRTLFGTAVPDQLYLSIAPPAALGWSNQSVLLAGIPPLASVDAEAIDFDEVAGTVEILVSAGGRCLGNADGGVQWLLTSRNPAQPFGLDPFVDLTLAVPPGIQAGPFGPVPFVNDMELGDWSGITHVRDVGMATSSPAGGHMWWTR